MNERSSKAEAHNLLRQLNQEIKAPLSAITGVALSLADRLEGDDAAAAHLIAHSCERLVCKIDHYISDNAPREQRGAPLKRCEEAT